MPTEFDPRWEYWMPDAEVVAVLYPSCLPDGSIRGYIGYGVETGFRLGWGASELRALPFRERGGRVERVRVVVDAVCGVCGRAYRTARVEVDGCGAACRHRAEQVSTAIAMRRAGERSLAKIAAAVGVNHYTVNNWLKRAGLTRPRKRRTSDDGQTGQSGAHTG